MLNIRIELNHAPRDGETVTFKAPCDAKEITGLVLYYVDGDNATKSQAFTLTDANGGDIGVLDNIFSAGALVKVILDTVESKAFMQNADTNAYLEGRFEELGNAITAADKVFVIYLDDFNHTDTTYEEICEAGKNGCAVFAVQGDERVLTLTDTSHGQAIFEQVNIIDGYVNQVIITEDGDGYDDTIPITPEMVGINTEDFGSKVLFVDYDADFDMVDVDYEEIEAAYFKNYAIFGRVETADYDHYGCLPLVKIGEGVAEFMSIDIANGLYSTLIVTREGDVTYKTQELTPGTVGLKTENWTFTLEDGSTVTKAVYVG